MRLTQLPSWLDVWGLPYTVVPGFERRGVALPSTPRVVIAHHTATPWTARGDIPTLGLLVNGRPAPLRLPGPLSQLGLGRSGHVYCIASGKANHAGVGRWRGVSWSSLTVGIEAEHPGDGSEWPQPQLDAYDRLVACLLWGLKRQAEDYCAHREWALPEGRKPDPRRIDMNAQRARVRGLLIAGPHQPNRRNDMQSGFLFNDGTRTFLRDGGDTIHLPDLDDIAKFEAAGYRNVGKLSEELTRRLIEAGTL